MVQPSRFLLRTWHVLILNVWASPYALQAPRGKKAAQSWMRDHLLSTDCSHMSRLLLNCHGQQNIPRPEGCGNTTCSHIFADAATVCKFAADPTSRPINILAGLDLQVMTCYTSRHMPSGASPLGGGMASMTFEPTVDGGTRIACRIWSSHLIAP